MYRRLRMISNGLVLLWISEHRTHAYMSPFSTVERTNAPVATEPHTIRSDIKLHFASPFQLQFSSELSNCIFPDAPKTFLHLGFWSQRELPMTSLDHSRPGSSTERKVMWGQSHPGMEQSRSSSTSPAYLIPPQTAEARCSLIVQLTLCYTPGLLPGLLESRLASDCNSGYIGRQLTPLLSRRCPRISPRDYVLDSRISAKGVWRCRQLDVTDGLAIQCDNSDSVFPRRRNPDTW